MKQVFIQHKKENRKLLLFFSGWASNEQLFSHNPIEEGYDCLLCYDYRELSFDAGLLEGYTSIRLLGWSMGVWAASKVLGGLDLPWEKKLAINGTCTPVHDTQGIPVEIYHGTISHLSAPSLRKFFRRMCGSTEEFKSFLQLVPPPVIEELQEELIRIEENARTQPDVSLHWDQVLIGENDLIFPTANQLNAWKGETDTELLPVAHYNSRLFADSLAGKGEIWTRL